MENDNLVTVLQAIMNAQQAVTVYCISKPTQLTDGSSAGRSGKVVQVGQDYFSLEDAPGHGYLIPINAITPMEPLR